MFLIEESGDENLVTELVEAPMHPVFKLLEDVTGTSLRKTNSMLQSRWNLFPPDLPDHIVGLFYAQLAADLTVTHREQIVCRGVQHLPEREVQQVGGHVLNLVNASMDSGVIGNSIIQLPCHQFLHNRCDPLRAHESLLQWLMVAEEDK